MVTNEQKMAQKAFERISERKAKLAPKEFKEYRSFAMSFPSLIHTCGLVQAMSFAQAKSGLRKKNHANYYIEDIDTVFAEVDKAGKLVEASRTEDKLTDYMRMTLHALSAATWLKRYCQAFSEVITDELQTGAR